MGSADTAQLDRLQFKWENSKYLWYFAEPRLSIFFLARNYISLPPIDIPLDISLPPIVSPPIVSAEFWIKDIRNFSVNYSKNRLRDLLMSLMNSSLLTFPSPFASAALNNSMASFTSCLSSRSE